MTRALYALLYALSMRRITLVVWGLLAAIALAGCTAAPAASPSASVTATPSVTPTPTPTPTPTVTAAAAIIVRADGFHVVTTDGEVRFSHDWADEVDPAVAELTEVFASEPVIGERTGDESHFPDYRLYTWPGFELRDAVGMTVPRSDYFASSGVHVTTEALNNVQIATEAGIAVGSSFDEVESAGFVDHMGYSYLLAEKQATNGEMTYALAGVGNDATRELDYLIVPVVWGL